VLEHYGDEYCLCVAFGDEVQRKHDEAERDDTKDPFEIEICEHVFAEDFDRNQRDKDWYSNRQYDADCCFCAPAFVSFAYFMKCCMDCFAILIGERSSWSETLEGV